MYNKYYIFLVMSCILWGFQPVTIKFVTLEMDILTVIPIRYLFFDYNDIYFNEDYR